jgi:hypothetical protein
MICRRYEARRKYDTTGGAVQRPGLYRHHLAWFDDMVDRIDRPGGDAEREGVAHSLVHSCRHRVHPPVGRQPGQLERECRGRPGRPTVAETARDPRASGRSGADSTAQPPWAYCQVSTRLGKFDLGEVPTPDPDGNTQYAARPPISPMRRPIPGRGTCSAASGAPGSCGQPQVNDRLESRHTPRDQTLSPTPFV